MSVMLEQLCAKGRGGAVVLAILSGCGVDDSDAEGGGTSTGGSQQPPDDGTSTSTSTRSTSAGPSDATGDETSSGETTGRETSSGTASDASSGASGSTTTGGGTDEPVCGNGVLERGEECDDGNRRGDDACSSGCENACRILGAVETFGRPDVIIPVNFNGDEALDLFLGHSAGSAYSLLAGDGMGGFEVLGVPGGGTHIAGAGGDFDGDGQTEVVRSMLGSGNGLYDVGLEEITPVTPLDVLAGYSYALAAGDVQPDADLDVVAVGGSGLLLLSGDGDGGLTASVGPGGLGLRHVALADLDGDDDLDAVATEDGAANVVVFEYESGAYVQHGSPWPFASGWISLADVDGDGTADLIGAAPGEDEALRVAAGNGDMTFAAAEDVPTAGIPARTAIADVNDDGSPDIVVTSSSGVEVLLGDGAGTFPHLAAVARPGGQRGLALVDVDGDGVHEVVSGSTSGPPGILVVACTPTR